MSGSASYYINESMSESSGDSLNNSNNGKNTPTIGMQQTSNVKNNSGQVNGVNLKGIIN